jgi:ubiquinone/menaquinone biosynthesis C-methylase UbiE
MTMHGSYDDKPILAELYDLVPSYISRPDADFYLQYAATTTGQILELGCGTGRILLPIAEIGCSVTGLDISEHMLSQCRRKLKSKSKEIQGRVKLIRKNMTDFNLEDNFHLAIIPFRAFQHLMAVEDQLSCLKSINQHLVPNAKLILDVFQVDMERINNPSYTEEVEDFAEHELADGRLLRRTHRIAGFHPAEQYNDVELIYYLTDRNGATERIIQTFPFRYFFRYEMQHLLERCGFQVVNLFGNFDKSPLRDDSPEMIFVTEKCL